MRSKLSFLIALTLGACGQAPSAQPAVADAAQAQVAQRSVAPSAWAICDAVDAPMVLIFANAPSASAGNLTQIDKTTGATSFDGQITYGEGEGAAGSVFSPFSIDGQDAGHVRNINPGMLENPGSAYTLPVTSVKFRDADIACRWLPRTRLVGVTARRTLVVHEDPDGDLIYTTFDFSGAAARTPIELSENGRSTTFSAEVRGGEETVAPGTTSFRFAAPNSYEYRVLVDAEGPRLEVWRNGALAQSEPLIAYEVGQAE